MTDAELIKELGGPAKVAELLGFDKANGGVQRVQNWMTRGIPSKVKLEHAAALQPRRVPACAIAAPGELDQAEPKAA